MEDLLGHGPVLDTLVRVAERGPAPGCVAVYGPWGAGKTTLLEGLKTRLGERGWPVVWFNPWQYEQREDVISPLIHAVCKQAAPKPDQMEIVKNAGMAILNTIASFGARAGAADLIGAVARMLNVDKARALPAPDDVLANWSASERFNDEIEGVKARFAEIVDASLTVGGSVPKNARLIVILDDLDRCLPESVVDVIEAVKLLLCGSTSANVMFFFGLDREIVGEAIRKRYPGATNYTGESYLEKIFDLSLETPPVHEKLVEDFLRGKLANATAFLTDLNHAFGIGDQAHGALVRVLSSALFANPRLIGRILVRLELLFAQPSGSPVRTELKKLVDAKAVERFVTWVAVAERYRLFRVVFRRFGDAEIRALVGDPPANWRDPEIERIRDMPGFDMLRKSLELKRDDTTAKGNMTTLRDFDDLLRSVGL